MKITPKDDAKKRKTKKKAVAKPKKEKVRIVAQEINFARLLSSNEKTTRDRALKSLKKWLVNCCEKGYEFKEADFSRIWKGLFYAVWMSDKPLVQEELCESIASLLSSFPASAAGARAALRLWRCGLRAAAADWYGVDHHRMDKCLMLVRRWWRGGARVLRRCGWAPAACQLFAELLTGDDGPLCAVTPAYARNAGSLLLHVLEIYLEEFSKVSEGAIPPAALVTILQPLIALVCSDHDLLASAARRRLTALLRQSDLGLEYEERTRAWKRMGCPAGGPDALEPASDDDDDDDDETVSAEDDDRDDDEDSHGPLDPRAGRVDVSLEPLPVPAEAIAAALRARLATAPVRAQKRARICLQRFEELSKQQYPLKISTASPMERTAPPRPARAAAALKAFDEALLQGTDELALRGLGRKRRKRLLARRRAGHSIVEEAAALGAIGGSWRVEAGAADGGRKRKQGRDKDGGQKKRKTEVEGQEVTSDNKQKKKKKGTEKAQKVTSAVTSEAKDKLSERVVNKKAISTEKAKKETPKENGVVKVKNLPKLIKEKTDKNITELERSLHSVLAQKSKSKKAEPIVTRSSLAAKSIDKNKKQPNPTLLVNKTKKFQKETASETPKTSSQTKSIEKQSRGKSPTLAGNRAKTFNKMSPKNALTPKKVKFVLQNNSAQAPGEYYRSVRLSPAVPFDSKAQPSKTNLKVSTPSPINPFFKKKLRLK